MCAEGVRWGNAPRDSLEINRILQVLSNLDSPKSTDAAQFFIGRPYVASTLEGEPEMLTFRADVFDCTTFVETCIALAEAAAMPNPGVDDFLEALRNLRYRDGVVDGYASRLHYISDWIRNADEGRLTEITCDIPGSGYVEKSLNFMSKHPNLYPALKASPVNVAEIERIEAAYQNFKMPYIPIAAVNSAVLKELRDGDIVAFTTGVPGLDVSHIGLITIKNGIPHLAHASSTQKRVVTTPGSLTDYLKTNRKVTGIRIFRLHR